MILILYVIGFYLFIYPSNSLICKQLSFPLHRRLSQDSQCLNSFKSELENQNESRDEAMYSVSYDILEAPNVASISRDLEDMLLKRSLRFLHNSKVSSTGNQREICYIVGLEDKSLISNDSRSLSFSMEESLSELSELSGAAGLLVAGSTYQRVQQPNLEYYIGPGKTKEIAKAMAKLKCTCVIFDTELSPSQQKNLEISLNEDSSTKASSNKKKTKIKVIDRTALILDIFAQHARTREGQLQVQLALLLYRLPRLTNMWSHLERQSAGARGKSNGGVGLRGPGEKQLESDRREMKKKISILNKAIDQVRRHRSIQRLRRRRLGYPVIALVGYTNAGKSTVLNTMTNAGVYVEDMLFATLDPTTRLLNTAGLRCPNILLTDTVGFISKLPTNLVAAFRATLEEIKEADVLMHVIDVSNSAWKKQEASVLNELCDMGLNDKPIVTIWNKIDLIPQIKEQYKYIAETSPNPTVALSAISQEGIEHILPALEKALESTMVPISTLISYNHSNLLDSIHSLGILDEVKYHDEGISVIGKVPSYLREQILSIINEDCDIDKEGNITCNLNEDIKDFNDLNDLSDIDGDNEDLNSAEDDWMDETKLVFSDDYY